MKKTIFIGLMAVMVVTMGFAEKASAEHCNQLHISSGGSRWLIIPPTIKCHHGKVYKPGNLLFVGLSPMNLGMYGPECDITLRHLDHMDDLNADARYKFQQNYCWRHSGDITVTHLSGTKVNFKITEGDYSDDKAGKVEIIGP